MRLGVGMPLASLSSMARRTPGWVLPGNPSLQLDLGMRRAWQNGRAYYDEPSIKALFSTWSTPAHFAIGKDGVLYAVPANALDCFYVPVGMCNGQSIEEARTNLRTWSEDLTNAAWTKLASAVVNVAVVARQGALLPARIIEDNTNAIHGINDAGNRTSGFTGTRVAACRLQADTRRYVQLLMGGGLDLAWVVVDTQTWTVTQTGGGTYVSAGIIPLANGALIWLCQNSGGSSCAVQVAGSPSATPGAASPTYAGDGSAITVWGLTVENGVTFPLSYVATLGSAVTRAASDIRFAANLTFPMSAVVGWYDPNGSTASRALIDRLNNGYFGMGAVSAGSATAWVNGGGTATVAYAPVAGTAHKIAAAFEATGRVSMSFDGSAISTNAAGSGVADTGFRLGALKSGSVFLNGSAKRTAIYDRTSLDATQLRALAA